MKRNWWKMGFLCLALLALFSVGIGLAEAEETPKLADPVFSIPERVEIGTVLNIGIGFDSNTSYANIHWYRSNDDDWDLLFGTSTYSYYYNFGNVEFDTATYGAGLYRVVVECYSYDDYGSSSSQQEFEVYGTLQPGPSVNAPTEGLYGSTAPFSISYENATQLEIRFYDDESYSSYSTWEVALHDQTTFRSVAYLSSDGVISIQARALINGEKWTAWGEAASISVISYGKLDEPVFVNPPTSVQAGHAFEVEINPVSNAERYEFYLAKRMTSYWNMTIHSKVVSATETHVILNDETNSSVFDMDAGDYEIQCYAYADGYEYSYTVIPLTVTGEMPVAPAYYLDKQDYYVGDRMTVTLEDSSAILQAYTNGGIQTWANRQSFSRYLNDTGEESVQFRVFENGYWTSWCEDTVDVKAKGELEILESIRVSGVELHELDEVTEIPIAQLGDPITLQIPTVANAERYEIMLFDFINGEIFSSVSSTAGEISLGQLILEEGKYEVYLTVSAKGYETLHVPSYAFYVTGSREEAPTVSVSATKVKRDETVTFDVSADSASSFRMRIGEFYYQTYVAQNGRAVITLTPSDWGDDVYSFSSYKNGEWSDWSDPISVTVDWNADGITLAKPNYATPTDLKTVTTTSGMTMDVIGIENARDGYIAVEYRDDEHNRYLPTWNYHISDMSQTQEVKIPAIAFAQPGLYEMYIDAYSEDYAVNSYNYWFITVTGDQTSTPDIPTFTLAKQTTVYNGDSLSFVATSNGVISNVAASCNYFGAYRDMVGFWEVYLEDDEPASSVTVRMHFEDSSYIGRDVNVIFSFLVDGVWTEYSDEYTFTVQSKPSQIDNPVPTLSTNKAMIGETVSVSFADVAHADSYKIYAASSGGDQYGFDVDSPASASFSTSKLKAGTWYISVYAIPEEGYQNSENTEYAILYLSNPPTISLATLTLPTALTTIESQAFYGTIAEKVVIPSKCTTIGSQAFAFAPNLTVVVIPASVKSIADDAFIGCGGLTIQTTSTSTAAYQFATAHGFAVTVGN